MLFVDGGDPNLELSEGVMMMIIVQLEMGRVLGLVFGVGVWVGAVRGRWWWVVWLLFVCVVLEVGVLGVGGV